MSTSSKVAGEGDWMCSNPECKNHTNFPQNFIFASKINCPKCDTGKNAKKAGDWCCPNQQCMNHMNIVYGRHQACPKCGSPKPVAGGNKGGMNGMNMNAAMMAQLQTLLQIGLGGALAGRKKPGDWQCPNAACKNHHPGNVVYASKTNCPLCGTQKPPMLSGLAALMGGVGGFNSAGAFGGQFGTVGGRQGDWHCPNQACKNHKDNVVYGNKDHCPLCGEPRPVKGVGGKKDGDWLCPDASCRNHTNYVYASRSTCNLCGSANPDDSAATPAITNGRGRSRSPHMNYVA